MIYDHLFYSQQELKNITVFKAKKESIYLIKTPNGEQYYKIEKTTN
jgi:hypothetical protein